MFRTAIADGCSFCLGGCGLQKTGSSTNPKTVLFNVRKKYNTTVLAYTGPEVIIVR
jgi:hypothetical protein